MKKFATPESILAFASEPVKVEEPKTPKIIVPDMPVWIADKWAAIAVHGSNLLSKKTMNIIGGCFQVPELEEEDHNCRSILIRDDGYGSDMAIAAYICKNMTLNLKRIFEVSVEEILENKDYSIQFGWHRNIILTVLHEINHLLLCHSAGEVDEAAELRRDEQADEWAWDRLIWMAKNTNIEPLNFVEEPFFRKMADEWVETLDEPFKSRQKHMLENKIMMVIGEELKTAKYVSSFKQVMHSMSGEPVDSEEWKKGGPSMADYIRETCGGVLPQEVGSSIGGIPQLPTTPTAPQFAPTFTAPAAPSFPTMQAPPTPQPLQFAPMAPVMAPAPAQQFTHNFHPAIADRPPQFAPVAPVAPMAPVMAPAPVQQALPNLGLSEDVIAETVKGVIYKAYNHIFANCGWELHSARPFRNEEKVGTPIPLTDLEKQVVFATDSVDENGVWASGRSTADGLRGLISSEKKLPMYVIYINYNGRLIKRKLIPQNPATGSAAAKQAAEGAAIMFVLEGDLAMEAELKKVGKYAHWYFKIVNNEWIPLNNR